MAISLHDSYDFMVGSGVKNRPVDFIETTAAEPFWWVYGEGAGFMEERFYFYKNGIACNYEESLIIYNDENESESTYIKYVVFFKRDN